MKKTAWLCLGMLWGVWGFAQGVTVNFPAGGETLFLNSTVTISWNAENPLGDLFLELYKEGVRIGALDIGGVAPLNSGPASCKWVVGRLKEGGPVAPGSGFTIRWNRFPQGPAYAESGAFSVVAQADFKVLAPAGGETWLPNSIQTISWTSAMPLADLYLDLHRNGTWIGTLAVTGVIPLNSGPASCKWAVGRLKSGSKLLTPGPGYTIRFNRLAKSGPTYAESKSFAIGLASLSGKDVTRRRE